MNLPKIRLSRPRLSLRFFIYLLFGLVILVLLVEGGYYYWVQGPGMRRETRDQIENTSIIRREGVYTFVDTGDGAIEKMIYGTITEKRGNSFNVKIENKKTQEVIFIGEKIFIAIEDVKTKTGRMETGDLNDLVVGDDVKIGEIYTANGQLTANYLLVYRRI